MVTPASAGGTPRELAPFIKRADEIQAHNSLMAYYCECAPARCVVVVDSPAQFANP